MRTKSAAAIVFVATILLVGACVGFNFVVSWMQFHGYDFSLLVNAFDRVTAGERPGIDFVNTMPLSYLAFLKALGLSFGLSWKTLIVGGALTLGLSSLLVFVFSASIASAPVRLLTIAALVGPYLVLGLPWHTIMAADLAVAFMTALLAALLGTARSRWVGLTGVAALSGIVFYSKQNVGPPSVVLALIVCAYLFIVKRERRAAIAGLAVAASIVLTTIFFQYFLGIGLPEVLKSFLSVSGRALPSIDLIRETIGDWPMLVVAWASIFILREVCVNFNLIQWGNRRLWICAGFMCVGGLAILTDWDNKLNNSSLLFAPVFMAFDRSVVRNEKDETGLNRMLMTSALCILLVTTASALAGVRRYRVEVGGRIFFYEKTRHLTQIDSGFFSGLRVAQNMLNARDDIAKFLAGHPDAQSSLFCGVRLEFCYADFNIATTKKMPLWWHPGSSYPTSAAESIVAEFKEQRIKYVAMLHGLETDRLPKNLVDYLGQCYAPSMQGTLVDFYQLKC